MLRLTVLEKDCALSRISRDLRTRKVLEQVILRPVFGEPVNSQRVSLPGVLQLVLVDGNHLAAEVQAES